MRYVIGLGIALLVLYVANLLFGITDLQRPWRGLTMGAVAGVTMVGTLIVWERLKPSEDHETRDKRIAAEEAAREEARRTRGADADVESSLEQEPPVDQSSEAARGASADSLHAPNPGEEESLHAETDPPHTDVGDRRDGDTSDGADPR